MGLMEQRVVGGARDVEELLKKKPGLIHRVLFKLKSGNAKLYELQKLAEQANVHVQQVEEKILDKLTKRHNGVVALCHEKAVMPWNDTRKILLEAKQNDVPCRIVVAANLEDPHNLGACIRSSLALSVRLMLVPAKGSCGLTPAVERSSAGTLQKMDICRPGNLEIALKELKEAGYQIVGLDGASETSITDFKFSKHLVMAIGGEDKGLPPYIRKFCDSVLKIPMSPEAHSYNTSVALSIGLYVSA
uniref:23S rRNA (Guanosine-O-)-methyltransferase rlmB n=1 Tax=uncultured bacterium contig00028 TaxID=1181517 RepID=A0A806KQ59_9BACT|nr:23S rRNA (guanosine-O-)-methyltransferase rlmB [uncultured bacterium contig00028]